jgi:glycosyltransferase involved in cell wall biosynthesis
MKLSSLSLVFPAYNEAENLPILFSHIENVVPEIVEDFEVIVVNDGSLDNTLEVLVQSCKKYPWLKYVSHSQNQGYGEAVKSGILAASKDYIFFSDADLQFDLRSLGCFFPYISAYKAVIGYRAPRMDNFIRLLNGWLWKKLVEILFSLKVRDLDCAFKIFHRDVQQIVRKMECKGAMFSTELLYYLKKNNWKWIELPVKHYPRKFGKQSGANIKVILRAFWELFQFWRKESIKSA